MLTSGLPFHGRPRSEHFCPGYPHCIIFSKNIANTKQHFSFKMRLVQSIESLTFKTQHTFTLVAIHFIHTRAIVLTGSGGTFVDVQVTVIALKSRHTKTLIHVDTIFADGSILTRLRVAFINVHLTVPPPVPSHTLTSMPSVRDVHTSAAILAFLL